jgi:PrtD family type I secretion system ABC transporter
MNWLFARPLLPAVLLAAAASAVLNLMLLVPALYTLQVFERVFTSRSIETLVMLSALVVISLALSYAMDVLRGRALALAGATLGRLLAPAALQRLLQHQAQPQRAAAEAASPEAPRDVLTLQRVVSGRGLVALFDAPWLPLHLLLITLMHPLLGAAAVAGTLALLGLAVLTELLTREPTQAVQHSARSAQRRQQQLLRRAEAIVGMGMAADAVAAWGRLDEHTREQQAALSRRALRLAAAARGLRQALQAALLGFGAWLVVAEQASPGVMVAATLLLARALQPAQQLIGSWQQLVQARAAWQRLSEPRLAGADTAAADATLELPTPEGRLDIERLVFGGGAGKLPLLRGIELTLPAGTSLGLIGASGSGKSSLVRLMLGLWKAQAGTVRLDGADIARWPRERLAPHIGWLPQEVELFAGTVAENIARLGEPNAAAVTWAAQRAGAHELILRLPQGYDTPVGEGGAALSGGQRQRIALARALYGSPKLVLLDEPDAHLDAEGEAALEGALQALKAAGTTVIVVTHKTRLLNTLDRVALLKDGVLEALNVAAAPKLRAVGSA